MVERKRRDRESDRNEEKVRERVGEGARDSDAK